MASQRLTCGLIFTLAGLVLLLVWQERYWRKRLTRARWVVQALSEALRDDAQAAAGGT